MIEAKDIGERGCDMRVDEHTILGDILDYDEGCGAVLESFGMLCRQCPASRGETVEEACEVHGVNPADLIRQLNASLNNK